MQPEAAKIQQPPPPVPSSARVRSRTLKKVLIVLGIVFIFVVIGAVLVVTLFIGAVKAPVDVTNRYIKAVNDGNAKAAWELLHPDSRFKTGYSFSEFQQDVVERSKGSLLSWNAHHVEVSGSKAVVDADITFKSAGEESLKFALRKKNGRWLIYDYGYE